MAACLSFGHQTRGSIKNGRICEKENLQESKRPNQGSLWGFVYLLVLIFLSQKQSVVYARICGSRGEAIHDRCELIDLPTDYQEKRLHLKDLDRGIFQNLPFESARSCAIVGLSESLLDCPNGKVIDDNEAVFRIGFGPLNMFHEHIGKKVNVTLCRSESCLLGYKKNADIYGFRKNEEYEGSVILRRKTHVLKWANIKGKQLTELDHVSPKFSIWDSSRQPYDLLAKYSDISDTIHPSTGLCLALDLLAASVCEIVNIYGLGGKLKRYHHTLNPKGATKRQTRYRNQNMKRIHSPSIEKHIIMNLERGGKSIHIHDCRF